MWPLETAPRLSKGFIAHRLGIPSVEAPPKGLIDAIAYNPEHSWFHLVSDALALDGRLWGIADEGTDFREVAYGYSASLKSYTIETESVANLFVLCSSLYTLARIIFLKHSFLWVNLQLKITSNYAQLAMWDKAHSDYLGFQSKILHQTTCSSLLPSCLLCCLDYSSCPLCGQVSKETSRRPGSG